MTEEVSPEIIKKTQDSLKKYIKRPPLTDKLLKKPPFRFLHDIVTNVINETGFLKGLYDNNEMLSENIKDRDSKINFLQKLIDTLKIVTEEKISARPSKIIAGLEPSKTNQLLQIIGLALEKKLDSSLAVQKVTGSAPTSDRKRSKKSEETVTSKPKLVRKNTDEKISVKKKPSPRTEKDKDKESKKSSQNQKTTEDRQKAENRQKSEDKSHKIKESRHNLEDVRPKTKDRQNSEEIRQNSEELRQKTKDQQNLDEVQENAEEVRPKTKDRLNSGVVRQNSDEFRQKSNKDRENSDELRRNSTEIQSSSEPKNQPLTEVPETKNETPKKSKDQILKPEVPTSESTDSQMQKVETEEKLLKIQDPRIEKLKLEDRNDPIELRSSTATTNVPVRAPSRQLLRPPSVRPSSARPAAPRLRERNKSSIENETLESSGNLKSGVKVIIDHVQEGLQDDEETVKVEEEIEPVVPQITPQIGKLPAEQGHLVKQILDQINQNDSLTSETPQMTSLTSIEHIQDEDWRKITLSIQTLTRAANPLGKLVGYVHEDVDGMISELKNWKQQNEILAKNVVTEMAKIKENAKPLVAQIEKLDAEIERQRNMIHSAQANVMRNQKKIVQLLSRE